MVEVAALVVARAAVEVMEAESEVEGRRVAEVQVELAVTEARAAQEAVAVAAATAERVAPPGAEAMAVVEVE